MRSPFLTWQILLTMLLLLCASTARSDGNYRPADQSVYSENIIRAIQIKLAELGYGVGIADGINGPMTNGAIAQFKEAEGLHPVLIDGTISEWLLLSLGLVEE